MPEALAAMLAAPRGEVLVRTHEFADPGPGEVLVRMEACGICHSDVMIAGLEKLPLVPLVMGHEGVGVIEAVGPGAGEWTAGDRVGITYLASSCGDCDLCRSGRGRYCSKQHNHGFTRHGALSSRGVVAAQNLVRIPDALPAEVAAPLCCAGWTAYGALREAQVPAGGLVAVFGLGGLGHLAVQYARGLGLRVAAVDVGDGKLELARAFGAEAVATPQDARSVILKKLGGADAAIVYTASAAAVPVAFSCLKRCGTLILVGLTTDTYAFSVTETVLKGIRVQGSYLGSRQDLEAVFDLAMKGGARPKVNSYALAQAPSLLDRLRRGEIAGRAVVRFQS